ncbi:hypothetical protein PDIDSM_2700 [Penicillium digitatum]|nr:hypothetical protein PDIDSM_2700 [Penicillium digitatum]
MVSAGLDTVPGNLIMGIAYLASEDGQSIQNKAYDAIMEVYPNGMLGEMLGGGKGPLCDCPGEGDLAVLDSYSYLSATREQLRISSGMEPLSLLHDFLHECLAADYDEDHFTDADKFIPERITYVAGSHLANRELFTAFIRLITAFQMHTAKEAADRPILNAIECNLIATALTTEPKPFKVGFSAADPKKLEQWIAESDERTRNL